MGRPSLPWPVAPGLRAEAVLLGRHGDGGEPLHHHAEQAVRQQPQCRAGGEPGGEGAEGGDGRLHHPVVGAGGGPGGRYMSAHIFFFHPVLTLPTCSAEEWPWGIETRNEI